MTPGFHDFPIQKLFATLAANYGTKDHIIQFASMIYVTVSMQPLTNGHSKQYVCTSCTCVPNRKNSRSSRTTDNSRHCCVSSHFHLSNTVVGEAKSIDNTRERGIKRYRPSFVSTCRAGRMQGTISRK